MRRIAANPHGNAFISTRGGFTMVEILVCVAIIGVLIAILLPMLARARQASREIVCQSNLRQLMGGFTAFAQDHDEQLPGTYWDSRNPPDANLDHRDWLRGSYMKWNSAPEGGTLFPYVARSSGIYVCPSNTINPPTSPLQGPGSGSNGRYDYVSVVAFSGARIGHVRTTSRLTRENQSVEYLETPVIVEGDPAKLNGFGMHSWHADTDTMSHLHRGGSFYVSIDSSIHWIIDPPGGCWNWESQAASGQWYSLGKYPLYWGQWNRQ